jgi:hypothetical protein
MPVGLFKIDSLRTHGCSLRRPTWSTSRARDRLPVCSDEPVWLVSATPSTGSIVSVSARHGHRPRSASTT